MIFDSEFVKYARWYLTNVKYPATTKEIIEEIKNEGYMLSKKRTPRNLSQVLSKIPEFKNKVVYDKKTQKKLSLWYFEFIRPVKKLRCNWIYLKNWGIPYVKERD